MWPNRKGGLVAAVVAFALLSAVACGGEKQETRATTAPSGTQAAQAGYTPAPKDQQVLRVPYAEPDFLDPHKSQFAQDIGIERMLFKGLFGTDEKGNPIPVVARELPTQQNGGISADGKTLTIKLKDNQKWSDGSPLTAKDFEYSIKRSFNPKLASPYASFAFNIVGAEEYYTALGTKDKPKNPSAEELKRLRDNIGVRAVDDKTLEIKLKEPQGTILIILGLWNMWPVKQSVVEAGGAGEENTAWTKPGTLVGNGPFVLKDRKEKDSIILEANPNYTLEPKPKLQRIEYRIIEDAEVAFNAFQTGEIDLSGVPTSKIPLVESDPTLKKLNIRATDPTTWGVEFNHTVKPLDNRNVRLALAKAIDRDAFVKVVLGGVGQPTLCWLPPGTPGYNAADCEVQKFDRDAAKKALADAGFPNGQGFPELTLLSSNTQRGKDIAEFLQKQWKDVLGITIKIELVDAKTRSSRYSNSQFELFFGGWHEDYHDPENWIPELFGTNGGNNQAKYSNPKLDDLIKQAKYEQNNEKRIALYREMHKLIVEDVARANVYNPIRNVVVKSKVKNLVANPQDSGFTGEFLVHQIEIAKE